LRRNVSNRRAAELVWVAQPSACCGERGGVGRGCSVTKRGMRPRLVVVISPDADDVAGVIETEEQALFQQLVTHPAVETFTETVLRRLARTDVIPGDAMLGAPGEDGVMAAAGL
jgi:hypothetical protein